MSAFELKLLELMIQNYEHFLHQLRQLHAEALANHQAPSSSPQLAPAILAPIANDIAALRSFAVKGAMDSPAAQLSKSSDLFAQPSHNSVDSYVTSTERKIFSHPVTGSSSDAPALDSEAMSGSSSNAPALNSGKFAPPAGGFTFTRPPVMSAPGTGRNAAAPQVQKIEELVRSIIDKSQPTTSISGERSQSSTASSNPRSPVHSESPASSSTPRSPVQPSRQMHSESPAPSSTAISPARRSFSNSSEPLAFARSLGVSSQELDSAEIDGETLVLPPISTVEGLVSDRWETRKKCAEVLLEQIDQSDGILAKGSAEWIGIVSEKLVTALTKESHKVVCGLLINLLGGIGRVPPVLPPNFHEIVLQLTRKLLSDPLIAEASLRVWLERSDIVRKEFVKILKRASCSWSAATLKSVFNLIELCECVDFSVLAKLALKTNDKKLRRKLGLMLKLGGDKVVRWIKQQNLSDSEKRTLLEIVK